MWEHYIINDDLIIRDYLTSDFGELAQLVVCSIRVDLLTSTSKRYILYPWYREGRDAIQCTDRHNKTMEFPWVLASYS